MLGPVHGRRTGEKRATVIRISGITPSGRPHLGNYLGAIQHWAAQDGSAEDLYFVSNLHAMTNRYNPANLHALTMQTYATLVAAGLDQRRVFVQSDLMAEHTSLAWILECVCTYGEAGRMIQFKEKSTGQDGVRLGLLTYPVLMAADILLHGAREVPVGEDQRQHVELARALANRFNTEYGEVFTVPDATTPPIGARVMSLDEPSRKMAKSSNDSVGIVFLRNDPDLVRRKFARAVTDSVGIVRYDRFNQPGVANLLDILAAAEHGDPHQIATEISGYAELKKRTAETVIERLRPVRERVDQLLDDPAELERLRAGAAELAAERAHFRLQAARRLAGIG